MTVRIDIPANDDKNFYKEVVNIAWQFRKLKKKPEAKLHNMKMEAIVYLIISLVMAVLALAVMMAQGTDTVKIAIFVVMAACAGLSLSQLNTISKMTKSYMDAAGDSVMTLDESSITLEKKGENAITLNWDNTLFLRFLDSTICMMSKNEPVVLLVVGIRHKDEILDYIKENHIEVPIIG